MAAGALEACAVLLLSLSLSLFLRLPYLWFPALDLSGLRGVCLCLGRCKNLSLLKFSLRYTSKGPIFPKHRVLHPGIFLGVSSFQGIL